MVSKECAHNAAYVDPISIIDLWKETIRPIKAKFLGFRFVGDSLVLRPNARAHETVWLHRSKSLGSLQNLKASNGIAKRCLLE